MGWNIREGMEMCQLGIEECDYKGSEGAWNILGKGFSELFGLKILVPFFFFCISTFCFLFFRVTEG